MEESLQWSDEAARVESGYYPVNSRPDVDRRIVRSLRSQMDQWLLAPRATLSYSDLPCHGAQPACNPSRGFIEAESARRWGAAGLDVAPYHSRALLSHLTALCYPRASVERLSLCHDVILFAFVFDDLIDNADGRGEAQVSRLQEQCTHALSRGNGAAPSEPLARMLRSIMDRICNVHGAPRYWLQRFTRSMQAFMDHALKARARWINLEAPLTPDVYLAERYHDVAVAAVLDLIELTLDRYVEPDSEAAGVQIATLRRLCAFNVALTNDLLSYDKEVVARGQTNNMMAVLEHHFELGTEEARSCVIHLARAAAEEFAACEEMLRARSTLLPALVRGMRDWMDGSFYWHMRSLRYVR